MRYKAGEPSAELLIDNEADLTATVAGYGSIVGIDTEFIRTNTFYPIPALYQLAHDVDHDVDIVLVDANHGGSFAALEALLEDPTCTKVMHACSEDLEVMDCHLHVRPRNLVDTQLAHAFVTPEFSKSYAALVEHYFGVSLPKHATRSNWLQRPLSDEQITYAREDVLYLVPLWNELDKRLEATQRRAWFFEEMDHYATLRIINPEEYYTTMKRAWRMTPRQLAVLRSITTWRENEARRRDVPRSRTVWDAHLVTLAETQDVDRDLVDRLLPRPVARRYGDALIEAVDRGREDPDPPEPLPNPLTQKEGQVVKEMRDFGRQRADELGFAVELLARKRDVEACLRQFKDNGSLSAAYSGWRADLVGERFKQIMTEWQI